MKEILLSMKDKSTHKYDIAILLATRGRTVALDRSIHSIVDLADDISRVQIMFALDRDDDIGQHHFRQHLQPWMASRKVNYTAMLFDPMGYIRLNVYNNKMAERSDARWFVIWNDDAIMQTQGWDTEIMRHDGEFRLLAFHTHRDHPYSIFPILPRKWYDLLGYISPHQAQDAWLSQQAYMLDIWQRIPVNVLHDRFDLTGNNKDSTFLDRAMLEGRPADPNDFHSRDMMDLRHRDCAKLATYIRNVLGGDVSFFQRIFEGKQDPWQKLKENDVNNQMVQFENPHRHFGQSTDATSSVNTV
jgi:hypothetical protein